jgi:hypothetical protein
MDPDKMKALLESERKWLLILSKPKLLSEGRCDEFLYAEAEIPWEEPVLKRFYPEDYEQYAEQIRRLRAEGRWEKTSDQAWVLTYRLARQGRLHEVLKERLKPSESPSAGSGTVPANDEALENTIKFVAIYFSVPAEEYPMSVQDFHRVTASLLGARTVEKNVQVENPEGVATIKTVERPLKGIWDTNAQELIAKCGLTVLQGFGGTAYVDFQRPELRSQIQSAFSTSHIWTFGHLFRQALEERLLFDQKRQVRAGAVRVVLEEINADPGGFGTSCLVDLARKEAEPFTPETRAGMKELLISLIAAQRTETAYNALAKLMESGRHWETWFLGNSVKLTPGFQSAFVKLLKRLLDEGPEELRTEARSSMVDSARDLGPAFAPILTGIITWTRTDRESARSPSQEFALYLVFDLLAHWLFENETGVRNLWGVGEGQELMEALARILFNAELEMYFGQVDGESSWLQPYVLAETWLERQTQRHSAIALAGWGLDPSIDGLIGEIGLLGGPAVCADLFRAMLVAEWFLSDRGHPATTAGLLKAMRELPDASRRRRALQNFLRGLDSAALAGMDWFRRESSVSAAQRRVGAEVNSKLRAIREATKRARAALSELAVATAK